METSMSSIHKPFRAVAQQLTHAMIEAKGYGYIPSTDEALAIVKAVFLGDPDCLKEACDNVTQRCDPDYPHDILPKSDSCPISGDTYGDPS